MPLFGHKKRQSTGPEATKSSNSKSNNNPMASTDSTASTSTSRRGSAFGTTLSKLNCNNYRYRSDDDQETPSEKRAAALSVASTHNTTLRDTESCVAAGPPSTVGRSKALSTEHISEMTLGTNVPTSSAATTSTPNIALTERSVYDWIWEYNEQFTETSLYAVPSHPQHATWNDFWDTYHTPDYLLVRPSGNSLDREGLKAMFETGFITEFCEEVMAVESIKILAPTVAVAVYKTEQIFYYQGQKEEDFATWTSVLTIHEGRTKIANIHRSTGHHIDAGGRGSN